MLHYDSINISEEIDLVKSKSSKECEIFNYWRFRHWFKF